MFSLWWITDSNTYILKDIKFPLSFRICLNDLYDSEEYTDKEFENLNKFKKFGYASGHTFYRGQSMFNESLVGWNGHTEDGETIGTTEG